MLVRLIFAFCVIAASASAFLYLASCTNYFNVERVKRLARNAGLLAAGCFIATLALIVLLALTS
jgi:hypothetical protein